MTIQKMLLSGGETEKMLCPHAHLSLIRIGLHSCSSVSRSESKTGHLLSPGITSPNDIFCLVGIQLTYQDSWGTQMVLYSSQEVIFCCMDLAQHVDFCHHSRLDKNKALIPNALVGLEDSWCLKMQVFVVPINSLPRKWTAIFKLEPASETIVIFISIRPLIRKGSLLQIVVSADLPLTVLNSNFRTRLPLINRQILADIDTVS